MPQNTTSAPRRPPLLTVGAPAALLALTAFLLLAGATNGRDKEARRSLLNAAHEDVVALRGEYAAAADEIEEQIRYASHVLGWMLEVELGGSAELLDGLEMVGQRVEVAPRGALRQLVASGAVGALGVEIAARLDDLYRQALHASGIGEAALEVYVLHLDTHLHPGVWHSQFGIGPDPKQPVDFGAAMRALRETPTPGALRHHLRAMEDRATALRAVSERTGPVLAMLDAALER